MQESGDIEVYSPDKKLKLVVEVKNKQGASLEWAAQMRRNLFSNSAVPHAPFFLLALPDHLYLWKNGSDSTEARPADFIVDAAPILSDYSNNLKTDSRQTSRDLELIFASWLNLVTISQLTADAAAPHEQWLLESGLYDAIKNGSVQTEASS